MKDNEIMTLNQLFSTEEKSSAKQLVKAESSHSVAEFKKLIIKEAKVLWPVAGKVILKKLMEALNIKVSDIMVEAWKKYKEIVEYTDDKKYPPDVTYTVALASHTIESTHKPYIEILFNNIPLPKKINFEIKIFLTLESIHLKIKGGRIIEVDTGSCRGGGSIKCENINILKKETKPFTLPGSISLGKGILIPKLTA